MVWKNYARSPARLLRKEDEIRGALNRKRTRSHRWCDDVDLARLRCEIAETERVADSGPELRPMSKSQFRRFDATTSLPGSCRARPRARARLKTKARLR